MSQSVIIKITTGTEAAQTIKNIFLYPTTAQRDECEQIATYFEAAGAGLRQCSYDVQVNHGTAVQATGTITFSGENTANDTILINGVTMTAVTSGATNNQWNLGATATLQAAAFVAAVNASTTSLISGQVTASNLAGVVTLTSNSYDIYGNAVTIAKGTDSGTVMTVSGARLTGGVAASANVYHFGQ